MKKVFGLDLGTTSIGWAVVNEASSDNEASSIVSMGVRVNPLSDDEQSDFEKGKSITTNADRRLKHGMRLNLQRFKLRRENLIRILRSNHFIDDNAVLAENGNATTFETRRLRAKAAVEEVSLEQLARVLLMINKKRGYKSSRKTVVSEDGIAIDGMSVARELYDRDITPGQYSLELLEAGKKRLPDFYRSDLQAELERVLLTQREYYPQLTEEFRLSLKDRNERQTWSSVASLLDLDGVDRKTKGLAQKKEEYRWRVEALERKLEPEQLAVVISKVNGQIASSSGYLGAISDRSKELAIKNLTIGQYQMEQLDRDPNRSLKNEVFYRQDYMDEFERIWETQARFHPELTPSLKKKIRDVVIFYQRRLKSQKGSVAICEFENRQISVNVKGSVKNKRIGLKVTPKSSPLFQQFKIWQIINNLRLVGREDESLTAEEKAVLFNELNWREKMTKAEILRLLCPGRKNIDLNYNDVCGNTTNAVLLKTFLSVVESAGNDIEQIRRSPSAEKARYVGSVFDRLGIDRSVLEFDSSAQGKALEMQPAYRLWHLLYSYEEDESKTGNERLINLLHSLFGFDMESAAIVARVTFPLDYGNLSAKAIRRILPYMKDGAEYSEACRLAGYNHSVRSLTRDAIDAKVYDSPIAQLPKNSLRNPVVEKILNQMINVVNALVLQYGHPDEIRIELARQMKKSAKERASDVKSISKATAENKKIAEILEKDFNIDHPSRNDIIRYRLYKELRMNGYKTLYSNTYISEEEIFGKKFNVEHIIPQARLFDDSFSNKTLELSDINIEKGNKTALDYVTEKYGESGVGEYRSRVGSLYDKMQISKAKRDNLLRSKDDIPKDFINRDLRDTQYISRKALEILEQVAPRVVATSGSVTDRLREDWGLVDLMQELNWDKYDCQKLTETYKNKDGKSVRRIVGWTKRNDHRHHAMDALTIAFTRREFIQYLNEMNSREDHSSVAYAIEHKYLYRDSHGKLRFRSPLPLGEMRSQARDYLSSILVSVKSKSKVVTKNVNTIKRSGGTHKKVQLTPRGQLHNDTVYGSILRYVYHFESVNSSFDMNKIAKVASKQEREALERRLADCGGDPRNAFTGKNSLSKNPLYCGKNNRLVPEKVKLVEMERIYTVRKAVTPDLNLNKVVDSGGIVKLLQQRLDEFGGDAKKAFSNLDENPIYFNRRKGIEIKRVTVKGPNEVQALHSKRDHLGRLMLDAEGHSCATDYVSTSNNHHVAIYQKPDGNLVESVVSFIEAVARAEASAPVVDRNYRKDDGWRFLFSMKRNEYFVFPRYERTFDPDGNEELVKIFDPKKIDLYDQANYPQISPNLFRVQKLSTKNYVFRHHLETTVDEVKELRDHTWKRITSLEPLKDIVKVRVDHLGRIVKVGEY